MAPVVAPYVSSTPSSCEAWTILECMFASQSRQRVIHLKEKLRHETLTNRLVVIYLQTMRTTVAELDLINAPVTNEDLILYVLRGLPEEYGKITVSIRARDTTIHFEDLRDRLVGFEADRVAVRSAQLPAPTTAFSSVHSRPCSPGRYIHPAGGSHGISPARRSSSPRSSDAYSPSRSPAGYVTPAPSLLDRPRLVCQFCDATGHSAKDCYHIRGPPHAHHTSAGSSPSGWLVDSTTTNHMTPDLGQLSLH
ncbi:unnamed protein product [Linum trigynum]|uniref:CCHC-type domain-containing protein n=1 Tax=Linum trigynum TaxID=586398 RepID=A0AAV2FD27_9ROSI